MWRIVPHFDKINIRSKNVSAIDYDSKLRVLFLIREKSRDHDELEVYGVDFKKTFDPSVIRKPEMVHVTVEEVAVTVG